MDKKVVIPVLLDVQKKKKSTDLQLGVVINIKYFKMVVTGIGFFENFTRSGRIFFGNLSGRASTWLLFRQVEKISAGRKVDYFFRSGRPDLTRRPGKI